MTSQTLAPRQMYMELLSASVIDTNTFSSKSAAGGLLSRKLTSLQVYKVGDCSTSSGVYKVL